MIKWNVFIVVLMIAVLLVSKGWTGEPFLMKESKRITKNEPGAIYGKQLKTQETAWYKEPCAWALLAILVGITISAERQDKTAPAPPGTITITIPTL